MASSLLGRGGRDRGFLRETSALGFWNCAYSCNASSSCLGFLLHDGRCLLREPPPTSSAPSWPEAADGLQGTAFLRAGCWTYSCPDAGSLILPPSGKSVDAASCCSCPAPHVKNLEAAPHLVCEPCDVGRAPAVNGSACEACPTGEFAQPGTIRCSPCGEGSVPSENRGFCQPCEAGKFSPGHVDVCETCAWPLILYQNVCIWWHLPALAFAVVCFLVAAGLLRMSLVRWKKRRKARTTACVDETMATLYEELWGRIG